MHLRQTLIAHETQQEVMLLLPSFHFQKNCCCRNTLTHAAAAAADMLPACWLTAAMPSGGSCPSNFTHVGWPPMHTRAPYAVSVTLDLHVQQRKEIGIRLQCPTCGSRECVHL
jgi:hypothetical protein